MENENGEMKSKDPGPSFFRELGRFMNPYRALFSMSVILSILAVSSSLLSYVFLGRIASNVFRRTFDTMWTLVAAAALCRIVYALLLNFSTWMSHRAAYRTLSDIRKAMAVKMIHLPMGYFEEKGSGRIKTLMTDQVEAMEKPLAHMIPEMTADLLVPLALLVWLFVIDWRIALVSLAWMILGFGVTGGMMKDYPEKYSGQLKAEKQMNQAVTEYVGGIEVIKNFGQAERVSELYDKAVTGHAEYNVNWQKETLRWSSAGMAIAPFSVFPVLIAGLVFYRNGTITPDEIFFSVLLVMGIFGPLMNASSYFDQVAQMGTVAKEMNDILEHEELKRGDNPAAEKPSIEFRNVSFSYGKGDDKAIDDVSFKVKPGSMLALVGPSGSGKSTIAKLLAGFWDVTEGEILLDGKPLNSYSENALNKMVAFVDQDTYLFEGTIRDNIRMAKPDATDEEIERVAKAAGCDEFIRNLPDGYDTEVGNAGAALSGGEKQRIAILRAMMKDSPVIILDEATASSDPENEALIQKSLAAAGKGRTVIAIAHHLGTIVNAYQIAYIDNHKVVKIGRHEELLESLDGYRKLWNLGREV